MDDAPRQQTCPVCGSDDLSDCLHIAGVPVYCNVLHPTRGQALGAPMGDLDLRYCAACGHLFNAAFDPARVEYSSEYENSLHHSPRFRAYARALAERLVADHDLHGKRVVEIACGQGDFLRLLCELGGNRGVGFDPGYSPERSTAASPSAELSFVKAYYTEASEQTDADLVCCRHALEHIAQPLPFLRAVRRSLGARPAAVYFEVPDAAYTLEALGVWDLIYEHCGYFTASSLRSAFERAGFRVDRLASAFGGQYLGIDAVPVADQQGPDQGADASAYRLRPMAANPAPAAGQLGARVSRFGAGYRAKAAHWRAILDALAQRGQRAVVWGAGSKGVSFLNMLGAGAEIAYLVDLNPHKHGRFAPGTGHQIRPPESLVAERPDAVIVLNPLYAEEIGAALRGMGTDIPLLVDGPGDLPMGAAEAGDFAYPADRDPKR